MQALTVFRKHARWIALAFFASVAILANRPSARPRAASITELEHALESIRRRLPERTGDIELQSAGLDGRVLVFRAVDHSFTSAVPIPDGAAAAVRASLLAALRSNPAYCQQMRALGFVSRYIYAAPDGRLIAVVQLGPEDVCVPDQQFPQTPSAAKAPPHHAPEPRTSVA